MALVGFQLSPFKRECRRQNQKPLSFGGRENIVSTDSYDRLNTI